MTKKLKIIVGICVVIMLSFILFIKYNQLNIYFLSPFATSTPIIITKNSETNQNNTEKIKTSTLSNFSFEYSEYDEFSNNVGWEGVPCPGEVVIRVPFIAYEQTSVSISTSPTTLCTDFNEKAKTLDDYNEGYKDARYTTVIHSSEKVTINNIPMLKQVYSQGTIKKNTDGKETLDTSDSGIDRQLRYVFFDGSKFVIVTGWQAPKYVEKIIQTIKLVK